MCFKILLACILISSTIHAQDRLISEIVLEKAIIATSELPTDLSDAYERRSVVKMRLDSLQQNITAAFPELANKMQKRSARLNSVAGFSAEGEMLSLIPFNRVFSDYFRSEWQKMDALEEKLSQTVKPFYEKELYKTQGYLPVWDSIYRLRRPALIRYKDETIKLVKAEVAYFKANAKMSQSSNEAERMQYFEEQLSVLQKLVQLRDRLQRIVIDDGVEKVEYCKSQPQACSAGQN